MPMELGELIAACIGLVFFMGLGAHMAYEFSKLAEFATSSRKRLFGAAMATVFFNFVYCVVRIIITSGTEINSIKSCWLYWQAYGIYSCFGKVAVIAFYCSRIYETFRGSPLAYGKRAIVVLLSTTVGCYLIAWLWFTIVEIEWADPKNIEKYSKTGSMETFSDCENIENHGEDGHYWMAVIWVCGCEIVISIIILRLYVRKVLIMFDAFEEPEQPPIGSQMSQEATQTITETQYTQTEGGTVMVELRADTDPDVKRVHGPKMALGEQSKTIEVQMKPDDDETNTAQSIALGTMPENQASGDPIVEATSKKRPKVTITGFRKQLLDLVTLTTNLAVITVISNFLVLSLNAPLGRWVLVMDAIINSLCVWFTFAFSRKAYNFLCYYPNMCCLFCCLHGMCQRCLLCNHPCCDCDWCHCDCCCGERAEVDDRTAARTVPTEPPEETDIPDLTELR